MSKRDSESESAKPRFRRICVIGLIGLVAGAAQLPWIASKTALRNLIVSEALAEPQLRVSTE